MRHMDRTEHRPPGGGVAAGTLASRLARVDEERFVGRAAELTALERCLDDDATFRVVHDFGPGGIGTSSLLREFARRAQERGFTPFAVEGRELAPTPRAPTSGCAASVSPSPSATGWRCTSWCARPCARTCAAVPRTATGSCGGASPTISFNAPRRAIPSWPSSCRAHRQPGDPLGLRLAGEHRLPGGRRASGATAASRAAAGASRPCSAWRGCCARAC